MSVVIDQETSDISQQRPRLLSELLFWPCLRQPASPAPSGPMTDAEATSNRRDARYRIEVPSQFKFYDIGYQEYLLISMFDGNTTVATACGKAAQVLGSAALTQQQANSIARWLMQQELACCDDATSTVRQRSRTGLKSEGSGMPIRFNPFWTKIPLGRAERLLPPIANSLGFLFSVPAMFVACIAMFVALLVVAMQWPRLVASAADIFSPELWVLSLLSWVGLKVLHEIGHAATAQRYGCRITQVGVVFVLFAPLAYVDVTTSWRLRSRWQRIVIAAGGMYVELLVAALAAIVWGMVDSPLLSHQLFCVMLAAGVSTLIFNANPLMRFDGYFILTDLLELPNLAGEGSLAIRDLASRLFYAHSVRRDQHFGWRKAFVIAYGIAALMWRILICISLAIAAAMLFHGAGIVLVAFAAFLWVIRPILAMIRSWKRQADVDLPSAVRAVIVAGCLCILASFTIFYLPLSSAIVAPAVVEQADDSTVRSRCDGFIESIHIVDGQQVRRNDLLFSLRNEALQQQLDDLQVQIKQSEIRKRTATQTQDIAELQIEQERWLGLQERLSQLEEQVAGLAVHAHRDGIVIARRLHDQQGRYVNQGDLLLRIAEQKEIRLLASIAQSDIRQALTQVGNRVQIRVACMPVIHGKLLQIKPLASTHVPSMALAGNNHGPLAVRLDEDATSKQDAYRLLEPRFEALIEMEGVPQRNVALGQTASVRIGYRSQTLYQSAARWLRKRIQSQRETIAQR